MKKIGFLLMLGLMLVVLGTNGNSTYADDKDVGSYRDLGGASASYSHVITYSDSRCGTYGRSHYRGYASRTIDHINIEWSAGGRTGSSTKYNASVNDTKSSDRLPIRVSYGKFSFKNGSARWGPNSWINNCGISTIAGNVNGDNVSAVKENNVEILQQIYENINTNGNFKISDSVSVDKTIMEIVRTELADSSIDLTEYQDENGKIIDLNDFVITSVKAENSVEPIADGVTFSNPNADNTTMIEVEIPKPVYEDGEKLKITGYVVLIDGDGPRLESGISVSLY